MPAFAMALVGLFAISGNAFAPVEVSSDPAMEESALAIAPETEFIREEDPATFTVKLTAYNAVPEQTDHNPSVTASGAHSNPEVVAARSVDLAGDLPFGTVIAVSREASDSENCRFGAVEHQIGYRVIADSMHSRKRDQIDILLNQENTVPVHAKEVNPALALGMCSGVEIRVIGRLAIKDIPETQEALRLLVEGDHLARN